MIAEPYINRHNGEITWAKGIEDLGYPWQQYACFEREKLRELGWKHGIGINISCSDAFWMIQRDGKRRIEYMSDELIGYGYADFQNDSESSRLLKRAEFLKAVCEKEGVEWLPKDPEFVVVGNEFDKPCSICGFAGEDMHHCVSELEKRFSAKKTAEIAAGMRWHGELEFRAALLDFLDRYLSHSPKMRKAIDELRDRFLSTPNKL